MAQRPLQARNQWQPCTSLRLFCPVQHSLYPDASQPGAHPWSDWELKRVPGQLPSTPSLPCFDRQPIPRCRRSRSPFSVAMTAFEKACRIDTPQVTSFIRRWKAEHVTIEVCNVPIINFIYWIGHSSNWRSEAYSWGTMQQIDASQFKYKGRVGHSQLFLPVNSTVRISRRRFLPRSFLVFQRRSVARTPSYQGHQPFTSISSPFFHT